MKPSQVSLSRSAKSANTGPEGSGEGVAFGSSTSRSGVRKVHATKR